MKRVLIAGAGSYIGERLAAWLNRAPECFSVDTADLRAQGWQQADWTGWDAVVLVAGIAHRKEQPGDEAMYDRVNHVLAVDAARKAKQSGVGQFVFFSSMSVYGKEVGQISATTATAPVSAYGRSKLTAETELWELATPDFQVAILRPPMIYGPGCRGNYPKLASLVQKLPIFPRVRNARSMLYIDHLCDFLAQLLQSGDGGLFFPQNNEYVATDALAAEIARAHGKRLWQPAGFGWLIGLLARRGGLLGKVFGTLTYDQRMSDAYRSVLPLTFADTVKATEENT